MQLLTDPGAITAWSRAQHAEGRRVGLVPTMGFLHAGHASLMALARPQVEALVISIYVNPLQFAPGEDLEAYPRSLEADLEVCRTQGVDAVFAPSELYPPDFSTRVIVEGVSAGLCGAARPTHFEGVATVVARLFGLTRCDLAVFGEKDYQQLAVIRRMARDLALPVEVVGAPLVRDHDGLALSSRNTYLSAADRARALSLSAALRAIRDAAAAGDVDADALLARGRALLDVDRLDYLELRDTESLAPIAVVDRPARALVAAVVGRTRLIDNLAVEPA